MAPPAVLPQYFQAYVEHVCPIRPRACAAGLTVAVPPRDVQLKRLELLETLPNGARGLALELLDENMVEEVEFIQETADAFARYEALFRHVEEIDRGPVDHSRVI